MSLSLAHSHLVTLVFLYISGGFRTAYGQNETPCIPGFYGTDCSRVCISDQDCAGGSDSCYSEFTFLTTYPNIPKSFACTTTSPDLVTNLIKPGSVKVQCYAPTSEVAKSGNCSFTFGIQDYANDVACEALDCDTGGSTISCGSIGCQCVSDANCTTASAFVKAFVGGVQGPASFTCEKQDGAGACTLNVPEFLVPEIGVTCTTGQCVPQVQMIEDTLNAPSLEYDGTSVNTALNACIAAIPTIVLCLMSVMVLFYWLKISPLYDVVPCEYGKDDSLVENEIGNHCLAWNHLSVDMPLSKRMRSHGMKTSRGIKEKRDERADRWTILTESSGEASSGEVVGVLGPSGCGKTTLLSALSGDTHGSLRQMKVLGSVFLDGKPIDPRRVAFLPQIDSLIPTMTLRENLVFTGILKLDAPRDDVKQRVESIMKELGISDIADSYVGGSSNIRGISGGERRRLTIGMALVSDPECLVLDEPLSGLDSYNALVVTKTLKSLARKGRIVMYSMHQPSDEMFNALDKVIFLAHGSIAYQGSPAGARQVLSTLDASIHGRPIADSMIDVLSNREMLLKVLETGRSEPLSHNEITHANMPWKKDSMRTSGICLQAALLFDRTLKDVWRNKSLLVLHVTISICAGLIIGGIFYNVSVDTDGVQARYGSIFISLCFLAFTSITSIDLLVNERMIVTAEVKEGLYNGSLYILSKLFIDGLFLRALPATLYSIPFYFMVGFIYDAGRFFSFLFVLILFNLCIGALAMLVTTCSKTAGTSLFVMNTLLLLQLSLTGFLVEVDSITPVLRWIHWLSQFYYAFEAMITTEMNQNKYNLILEAPGLKPIILEDTPGEMFIDTLGYQVDTATRNICILIGYYYGFVCLCLVAFYVRINLSGTWRIHIGHMCMNQTKT